MNDRHVITPGSIVTGDVLSSLACIEPHSIQVVVTSPPYWGMRQYAAPSSEPAWSDGSHDHFGLESTPEKYIEHSADVLRAISNVLAHDGTVWWNIGDTYFTRSVIRRSSTEKLDAVGGRLRVTWKDEPIKRTSYGHEYLKDKDLTLIPLRVALEAQKIGYWVRSVVVWNKANSVPERRLDRPVLAHEYILMLTKSASYLWNVDEARETQHRKPASAQKSSLFPTGAPLFGELAISQADSGAEGADSNADNAISSTLDPSGAASPSRPLRAVWDIPSTNGGHGHPAAFPIDLAERCIRLSSRPGDTVLDPFIGSGTTALAAYGLGRRIIGIDIVEEYAMNARQRLENAKVASQSAKVDAAEPE